MILSMSIIECVAYNETILAVLKGAESSDRFGGSNQGSYFYSSKHV